METTYTVPITTDMPDGLDLAGLAAHLAALGYTFAAGDGISRIVGSDGTPAYVLAVDRDPSADIAAYRPTTTPDAIRTQALDTYRAADTALAEATADDLSDRVKDYRAATTTVLGLLIPDLGTTT